MSGIFGIINLNGAPVRRQNLDLMSAAIAHRGIDGGDVWIEGAMGMGHLMTQITPESVHEHNPYAIGNLVITADARLDNRDELFHKLEVHHSERKNMPDSHLIVMAYKKWGQECSAHLLGEFSFAIFNRRSHTLFCARDHMGFRPFFYYHSAHHFIFASEIKSILALPFVPKELNKTKLAIRLLPIERDVTQTFFQGIFRIKCAHWLSLEENKRVIRSYWLPDYPGRLPYTSGDEYIEAMRELIQEAVHCRLRIKEDIPVGVTLSGGLDSSAVACIAARHLKDRGKTLHAFSAVLPMDHQGIERDERSFMEMVLKQEENIAIHYVTAPGSTPFDELETAFHETGNTVKALHYLDRALWRAARQQGVRALFSGEGGDNMVSYDAQGMLYQLTRQWRLATAIKTAKQVSAIEGKSLSKILKTEVLALLLPQWLMNIYRYKVRGKRRIHPGSIEHSPVNPEFARKYDIPPGMFKKDFYRTRNLAAKDFREFILSAIKVGKFMVEDENVREAAFGLNCHLPLFDKRIVEFFLALPPEHLLTGGWKRGHFRFAMADILPPGIQWRKSKTPFSPNFHRRVMTTRKEMTAFLNNIKRSDPVRQYLDIDKIKNQFDRVQPVKGRNDWENQTYAILVNGIILIKFLHWINGK
jgi:asparagine synthase (glutamine-hydrolysing)